MTTDQTTTRRWGLRATVAAIGVAAVIAALGGAAIYAATGGSQASTRPHQSFSPGAQPVGETSLHGEFVVRDARDTRAGYTTVLSQTGTVTASSPTSITVRSDDGYSQTYVIAQPAGPPPAINEPVTVRGTRDGQTSTVTAISSGN
jgi:hypothetical protein